MAVKEIIDQALREGDNVSPTSADYLPRRRLALSALRETEREFWWMRDWPWRRRDNVSVVVPVGEDKVNLPVDFNSLGNYGGVFTDEGGPLDEVPEIHIEEANRAPGYSTDVPGIFSIHGQDEVTFLGYLRVPRVSTTVTLYLFYQANPPFILDAGDTDGYGTVAGVTVTYDPATGLVTADATSHGFDSGQDVVIAGAPAPYAGSFVVTVTGADTFTYVVGSSPPVPPAPGATATLDVAKANRAILRIPSRYHDTVLVWGVRAKLRESKGDARWQYAEKEFVKAVKAALVEEARAQTAKFRQLPSFFGRGLR